MSESKRSTLVHRFLPLKNILFALCFVAVSAVSAQPVVVPNRGQWEGDFWAKVEVNGGGVFFRPDGYRVVLPEPQEQAHQSSGGGLSQTNHRLPKRTVAYFVTFIGSSKNSRCEPRIPLGPVRNYFKGKDSSRWVSNVPEYKGFLHKDLYPKIHAWVRDSVGDLQIDYRIEPGGDPSQIAWTYEGISALRVNSEGQLLVTTPLGTVIESSPIAYQESSKGRKIIRAKYVVLGNSVRFSVGHYDKNKPLIIDPKLIFSSFSGSSADNWGFTATYDDLSNVYGGGIVFNVGYPTTVGVFDNTYNGSNNDIDAGITKFNAQGTQRIFSTYLGGDEVDQPHSMIVASNGELIVMGTTASRNFPVTANAFQGTHGGGTTITPNGYDFDQGSDVFVTRFTASGSALVGSTYAGTNKNDGLSLINKNYGDAFRGEVNLDAAGAILVASSVQNTTEDAWVQKFTPQLNARLWSTIMAGSGDDAAYAVRVAPSGKIFITGGTTTYDLANTAGTIQPNAPGNLDGYIARLDPATGVIDKCTYLGTSAEDQSFCLDVDKLGNVYVFGQTRGAYPVSTGVWATTTGKQFIHKLTPDLQTTLFSTRFGAGNNINISPTALEVDDCLNIFLSGWGGQVNGISGGNTTGLPTTTDAFKSSTDGSDFYFLVLTKNATSLLYASFFGGSGAEHVDGGTSRFSKDGSIYQAVCASCGGGSFPTTPGVIAPTNLSSNCNLAVIKFDFETAVTSFADIDYSINVDTTCEDLIVTFTNNSINANKYFWDFGNGQTSSAFEPTVRLKFGTWKIVLTAIDTVCDILDTSSITIVHDQGVYPIASFTANHKACDRTFEVNFVNQSAKAHTYQWIFGDSKQSTADNPIHFYPGPGSYSVILIATDTVCDVTDTTYSTVFFDPNWAGPNITLAPDTCFDGRVRVNVSYGADSAYYQYLWTFPNGVQDTGRVATYRVPATNQYVVLLSVYDSVCKATFNYTFDTFLHRLDKRVWIPNAFTPNGDNINDRLVIGGNHCDVYSRLVISNSYGNVVFETDKPFKEFWDGTVQGKIGQLDTYVYRFETEDGAIEGYVSIVK